MLAQAAHAATLAANKWDIDNKTYVVVLESNKNYMDGSLEFILDSYSGPFNYVNPHLDFVWFNEPDLDNMVTAVATLNPPPDIFKRYKLALRGGEINE